MKLTVLPGVVGLAEFREGLELPSSVYLYGSDEDVFAGKAQFVGEPSAFGCAFSYVRITPSFTVGGWKNRIGALEIDGILEIVGAGQVQNMKNIIKEFAKVSAENAIRAENRRGRVTAEEALRIMNCGYTSVEALQSFVLLYMDDERAVLKMVNKITNVSVRLIENFMNSYSQMGWVPEAVDEIVVRPVFGQKKQPPRQVMSEDFLKFKAETISRPELGSGWEESVQEAEPTLSVLGAAHATHALASGLSGEITTISGNRVIIKGATKVVKVETGLITDEKIEQIQVSFDTKTRRLLTEGREFVENNLPQILGLLQSKKPLFDESRVSDETLRLIATKNRIELPGQISKTLALVECLKKAPFALYNGAPGIGKTHVSYSTVHLMFEELKREKGENACMKVLFSADGAKLIRKMKNEAEAVLGSTVKVRIVNDKKDIDSAVVENIPGKIIVYIASKDTAKRATLFTQIPNLKACPTCGKSFTKLNERKRGYANLSGGVCGGCGDKIVMPTSKNASSGKFSWSDDGAPATPRRNKSNGFEGVESLSSYIVRKYKYLGKIFDLFIVDEAHNMSAEESSQGTMMREFIEMSKKVMLLTGTLTNGYPSSVFYLLSAVMPKRLKEWGFEPSIRGVNRWIDSYGARKTVTRRSRTGNIKVASEKPTISPQMVMHHLAPFTVWGKLEDLNYPMPKFTESVEITQVEPEILQAAERAQFEAGRIYFESGSTRSRSSAITKAMLYMGNNPTKAYQIDVVDKGEVLGTVEIPALFDASYTTFKEQKLLEHIDEALKADRKVMIYTFFNVTAETASRLETVISREMPDVSVGVLPASIKASKLEEWFEAAGNKHQVVIVPYKRVATGLDIPQYPEVFFYEEEYNIRDVMQAARRPYRAVIQKKDVRVTHLMQRGIQETAMSLIAQKMTASKIVEGETYSEEGVESFAMESIELELQKRLAAGVSALVKQDFATNEIAAGRSRPWTKLERKYLEIVKEVNPEALKVIAPEEIEALEEDVFVDADSSEVEEIEPVHGVEVVFEEVEFVAEDTIEAIDCNTLEPVIFRGVVLGGKKKNLELLEGATVDELKNTIKEGQKIQLTFF